jgi:hypothetical protein
MGSEQSEKLLLFLITLGIGMSHLFVDLLKIQKDLLMFNSHDPRRTGGVSGFLLEQGKYYFLFPDNVSLQTEFKIPEKWLGRREIDPFQLLKIPDQFFQTIVVVLVVCCDGCVGHGDRRLIG